MVYLRGVMERKVTNDDDPDGVPILGYLPQTSRPENNMNYPTMTLDGTQLHHITVSSAGQLQVQFDAADRYVCLDGIVFARWSGDFRFDDWRFGTNNDDTMQIQRITNGQYGPKLHCVSNLILGFRFAAAITHALSKEGLMHTGRNGSAGAGWAHKIPYDSG